MTRPTAIMSLLILVGCGSDPAASPTGPSGSPGPATTLAVLSDEFDDPATLTRWSVRSAVENGSPDGSVTIGAGQLQLFPDQDRYFLNTHRGLSLFQRIDPAAHPDFVMETSVAAYQRGTTGAPTEDFHSAGLVVYPDLGNMTTWVVANIGRQAGSLAFEDKNTVNDQSNLTLYGTGSDYAGFIRLCITGSTVAVFTRLPSETGWTARNSFTHTIGTAVGAGVMINDYLAGTDLVEGRFDYVRYADITGPTGCTAPLP